MLETPVNELNDELEQEQKKRVGLQNLGGGFKRIEEDWAVKLEVLKDKRT